MPKISLNDIGSGYNLATAYNANNSLMEAAFENTLSRDGSTPNHMLANLDMNSKRIVNLGAGVLPGDAVNLSQLNGRVFSTLDIGDADIVSSYANMTAKLAPVNGDTVFVNGGGIAGLFVFDSANATPANGGTHFAADDATAGRWVRRFTGPVDIRWFGAGGADDSIAIQAAIDTGYPVYVPPGTWSFVSTLTLGSGTRILGESAQSSILSYTGVGVAFKNATPGTRVYGWHFQHVSVSDAGAGTTGIEMDSVSNATFIDVSVDGFTTQFDIYSPTSGYAVQNKFIGCQAEGATGFKVRGTSSDSNTFIGCGTSLCTTRGVDIANSAYNKFLGCHFADGTGGTAVYLSGSVADVTVGNSFIGCEIEGHSTGTGYHIADANVADTQILSSHVAGTLTPLNDSGTRTIVWGANADTMGNKLPSTLAAADGIPFSFSRSVEGSNASPCVSIEDSLDSAGTPTTLQVTCERQAGHAVRVMRADTEQFGVLGDGKIRTNQAAANVATPAGATAYQLPIYNETGTLLGYIPVYAAAWT